MTNKNMVPLPHPEELAGVVKYDDLGLFTVAGGTPPGVDPAVRYTASAQAARYYGEPDDVSNATEAADGLFSLFSDSGWIVFVWDDKDKVGWSFPHVGEDWFMYLVFKDLNSPGARAYREHGVRVNAELEPTPKTFTKKYRATRKALKKKKATKKKATKKKVDARYY